MSDGEYTLRLKPRMLGGGVWGMMIGGYTGKFVASVVCHGTIVAISGVVSVVATPAVGSVVFMSLESTFGSTIEATTTAVAVAGAIAGAVATGPV